MEGEDLSIKIEAALDASKSVETLGQMKSSLRELQGLMIQAKEKGDPAFQSLAEAAGKLKQNLKETTETVNMLGGTPMQNLSHGFSGVGESLSHLDFASFNRQMSQMATISKQLTFKDMVSGVAETGKSFLQLGKALLTNPMFLLPAIAIGIITHLKELKEMFPGLAKAFELVTEPIKLLIEGLKKLGDFLGLTHFKANEMAADEMKNNDERIKALDKLKDKHKEVYFQINKAIQDNIDILEAKKKRDGELSEDDQKHLDEYKDKLKENNEQIVANEEAMNKKIADRKEALYIKNLKTKKEKDDEEIKNNKAKDDAEIDADIKYQQAKLKILGDEGKAYSAEAEQIRNAIDDLNKQKKETDAGYTKEKKDKDAADDKESHDKAIEAEKKKQEDKLKIIEDREKHELHEAKKGSQEYLDIVNRENINEKAVYDKMLKEKLISQEDYNNKIDELNDKVLDAQKAIDKSKDEAQKNRQEKSDKAENYVNELNKYTEQKEKELSIDEKYEKDKQDIHQKFLDAIKAGANPVEAHQAETDALAAIDDKYYKDKEAKRKKDNKEQLKEGFGIAKEGLQVLDGLDKLYDELKSNRKNKSKKQAEKDARDEFNIHKALSLVKAGINIAEAITKDIHNLPKVAFDVVLGGVEIATIAAQQFNPGSSGAAPSTPNLPSSGGFSGTPQTYGLGSAPSIPNRNQNQGAQPVLVVQHLNQVQGNMQAVKVRSAI